MQYIDHKRQHLVIFVYKHVTRITSRWSYCTVQIPDIVSFGPSYSQGCLNTPSSYQVWLGIFWSLQSWSLLSWQWKTVKNLAGSQNIYTLQNGYPISWQTCTTQFKPGERNRAINSVDNIIMTKYLPALFLSHRERTMLIVLDLLRLNIT